MTCVSVSGVSRFWSGVVAACTKHGKYAGVGGVYTDELLARYVGMGCRFVLAGQDGGFLMHAAQQRSGVLRRLAAGAR